MPCKRFSQFAFMKMDQETILVWVIFALSIRRTAKSTALLLSIKTNMFKAKRINETVYYILQFVILTFLLAACGHSEITLIAMITSFLLCIWPSQITSTAAFQLYDFTLFWFWTSTKINLTNFSWQVFNNNAANRLSYDNQQLLTVNSRA